MNIMAVTELIRPSRKQFKAASVSATERPQSSAFIINMADWLEGAAQASAVMSGRPHFRLRSMGRFLQGPASASQVNPLEKAYEPGHLLTPAKSDQFRRDRSLDSSNLGPIKAGEDRKSSEDEG